MQDNEILQLIRSRNWLCPTNRERCCIYRVPDCLRQVNPEAYTPQLVLIGPLSKYLKDEARNLAEAGNLPEDMVNKKLGYLNMEAHKTFYRNEFAHRFGGQDIIGEFRVRIQQEESIRRIRQSYSESTDWITSEDLVNMILQDSVFILEFLLKASERRRRPLAEREEKTGDPLMDEPCLQSTIHRDLILLENQLPYFILEDLFNSIPVGRGRNQTFRELSITYFEVDQLIGTFQHFTDLFRRIRVRTLPTVQNGPNEPSTIQRMYNADKLHSGGLKLEALEREPSLVVKFEHGCLQIPSFTVDYNTEVQLRNIMALEQCHYPLKAYVCNYIIFMDYLIDTEKDVDLLVNKGIITNRIGHNGLVAEVVNKLCSAVVEFGSYYSGIATEVVNHYVDPETMNSDIRLELGRAPGMWRQQTPQGPESCSIYRVPDSLRRANPEAYTPQLVIIGPLHHSLKSQARESRGDITNAKSMGYLNMEVQKKTYLWAFRDRCGGQNTIDDMRGRIRDREERIRASYSESTAWIKPPEFVEMILEDSVFILEFLLKIYLKKRGTPEVRRAKTGDPLVDELSLQSTVKRDLMLLENQIPYFILEQLYQLIPNKDEIFIQLPNNLVRGVPNFWVLITRHFKARDITQPQVQIIHFTDLVRFFRTRTIEDQERPTISIWGHLRYFFMCICAGTPPMLDRETGGLGTLDNMYTAEKLDSGGVKLRAVEKEDSLVVNFVKGYLQIPSFSFERNTEVELRNIMALEQCHYPRKAYVCNHMIFLDFLIDTERDVDLLVEKGILKSKAGQSALVAGIVNKLCLGVNDYGSYYSEIARNVIRYYESTSVENWAGLKRVYFTNCWRGTATIAAALILLMTFGQLYFAFQESRKSKNEN